MKRDADAQEEPGDEFAYLRHADAQNAQAAVAWKAHVAGLSEEQRLEYEALGLIEKPGAKPAKAKSWTRVAAEEETGILREARSEDPDPAAALIAQEEAQPQAELTAVRFILAAIIDASRPRLEASIIAAAIGIGELQQLNAGSIAARYELPAQEVRDRIRAWMVRLNIVRIDLTLPRYVVSHVLDDKRPRLQADTFALALGFPLRQGMSERKLAIEYGLTVAALSARVIWWVEHMAARLPGVCKRQTHNYALRNVRRQPDDPFRADS